MKRKMIYLMLTLWIWSAASANAQVLIGGAVTDTPRDGAILDLKSSTQGLVLPGVELKNIGEFQLSDTPVEGMTVYNNSETTTNGSGKGIYVWNQDLWLFAGYYSGPLVIPVTGVSVTSPANVLLSGATMQFTATVAPESATNKAVFWDVVQGTGTGTITQEGLFTAEAPGSVQIRATSAENAAIKGTKNITVTATATDGSNKKATYTSYGVVGLDEAGEILSAGEYEYTTWIFPNGLGRWMTKNSKYGSPDFLQAADLETLGEGGYYSGTSKTTACPEG
jgi:hypothetical protein